VRILCAASAYPPYVKGGGSKAAENIVEALHERGHTVRVVTIADKAKFEIRNGVQVKTLRSFNIYWNYWVQQAALAKLVWHALENFNPRALLRMRREIAEFNPDIVLTISIENVNVATWVAAWSLGIPRVHVVHSFFLMCWRGTRFSNGKNCERPCLQCRISSIGKKFCSQLVDGVAAEASHTLSTHAACGYFPRAVSKVIPGAVGELRSSPRFRATETGPIRVGYIGMLTPNKGLGTLGDAAALLGPEAPLEYVIAGDGKPEFVQDLLSKFPADKTAYLGWVDSDSFYPSIDVLVVPSIWAEPFGNVCIEALSFGVPVIVANSGALPEIVEHEENGLVFKAGDPEALAACLRTIASHRRRLERMHHAALARAKQYSTEALAASWDIFLTQVRARAEEKATKRVTKSHLGVT
jgi:glycosyltransferase involved in cell wall biosynthesis